MKYFILAAATALCMSAATAHAASPVVPSPTGTAIDDNTGSLNALLLEWDRAAFNPPSKPSQYRVYGRNGYVASGPVYNAIVALIRSAVHDAAIGNESAEALTIARARSLLLASATPQITGQA